jgi:hypothetical protein
VTARDWLLVFIACDEAAAKDARGAEDAPSAEDARAAEDAPSPDEAIPGGLEPVRVQKGMFLLANEARLPAPQRYKFVAYNYGPMSRGVYRDVGLLLDERLVVERAVPGYTWGRIAPTARGRERARALAAGDRDATPARLARLREVRRTVTETGFEDLLRLIYRRYPKYAERSVFGKGAR